MIRLQHPSEALTNARHRAGYLGYARPASISSNRVRHRESMSALLLTLAAVSAQPAGAAAVADAQVSISASSSPVCVSERQPSYLNVDFIVHNETSQQIAISEIHASVINSSGKLVERRLVWQDALDLIGLGAGARVAPHSDAVVYNPLHFNSANVGARVDYEFDIEGRSNPIRLTISPRLCRTAASLILPLTGHVTVLDGHDFLSHHRRFDFTAPWARRQGVTDNFQRYAVDLVVVDSQGHAYRGSGRRNEDFFGWGAPVRAPGDGVIVATNDGQSDNDEVGDENRWKGKTIESAGGNFVLIRHDAGEFSLIEHMQQKSVTVRVGERVHAGQLIGRVGNSGSSLMPHVHYQLQNQLALASARSLPAYFRHVRFVSGEAVPSWGVILDSGDVVNSR